MSVYIIRFKLSIITRIKVSYYDTLWIDSVFFLDKNLEVINFFLDIKYSESRIAILKWEFFPGNVSSAGKKN